MKKTSLSAALIVFVCFFLPWIQVSCGASHESVSGVSLARDGHSILWLIPILIVATLSAAIVGAWKSKIDFGALLGFAAGLVSAYLMNRERIRNGVSSGLLEVRPTGWFWLGLAASVVLTVSSAVAFLKPSRPR